MASRRRWVFIPPWIGRFFGEHASGFTLLELLIVTAMLGTMFGIAIPVYRNYIDRARVVRAIAEIRMVEKEIALYRLDHQDPPESLETIGRADLSDPWGNPYQYLTVAGAGGFGHLRKDRWNHPLNSDYDLYSMGKDGKTSQSLRPPVSHDDIIRADDGGYVGLASEF